MYSSTVMMRLLPKNDNSCYSVDSSTALTSKFRFAEDRPFLAATQTRKIVWQPVSGGSTEFFRVPVDILPGKTGIIGTL